MHEPDDILRDLFALVAMRYSQAKPESVALAEPAPSPGEAAPVSLMITNRQRVQLRDLGYSDAAVAEMKPSDAHQLLGL